MLMIDRLVVRFRFQQPSMCQDTLVSLTCTSLLEHGAFLTDETRYSALSWAYGFIADIQAFHVSSHPTLMVYITPREKPLLPDHLCA